MLATTRLLKAAPPPLGITTAQLRRGITTAQLDIVRWKSTSGRRRLKFYFHAGGSKEFMASVAGQLAGYGVPQSRLAFESFGPSEAGEVLAQAA